MGWGRRRQGRKQIPGGNDRKKGKGFDAKGAKFATFRYVKRAKAEADSRRNDRKKGKGNGRGKCQCGGPSVAPQDDGEEQTTAREEADPPPSAKDDNPS